MTVESNACAAADDAGPASSKPAYQGLEMLEEVALCTHEPHMGTARRRGRGGRESRKDLKTLLLFMVAASGISSCSEIISPIPPSASGVSLTFMPEANTQQWALHHHPVARVDRNPRDLFALGVDFLPQPPSAHHHDVASSEESTSGSPSASSAPASASASASSSTAPLAPHHHLYFTETAAAAAALLFLFASLALSTSLSASRPSSRGGHISAMLFLAGASLIPLRCSGQNSVSAPTISSISPASGPKRGGTVVTVKGSGFVSGKTFCRFSHSSELVAATFSSLTEVSCVAPAFNDPNPGFVSIGVTSDGGYIFSSDTGSFFFSQDEAVASVTPGLGTEAGGTLVRVHGSGFVSSPLARCLFGSVPVTAAWHSEEAVDCIAPPRPAGTLASVRVANNGQDYSTTSQVFSYHGAFSPSAQAHSPRVRSVHTHTHTHTHTSSSSPSLLHARGW